MAATVNLRFQVKADLVVGGRMQPAASTSSALELDDVAEPQPGTVSAFYIGAWVGGGSQAFSLCPLSPAPEPGLAAELRPSGLGQRNVGDVELTLQQDDPDTIKVAIAFDLDTPKGRRACHMASSFIPMPTLLRLLQAAPRAFSADQECISMRDNFTRNVAVLRFKNGGTNLAAAARIRLRRSSLHDLDEVNTAVQRLGREIKAQIGRFAVTPLNAGPQYVEAFTYGPMQGHLSHYAVLGRKFAAMSTPVNLPWLMYDLCQSLHATGVGMQQLAGMGDVDLVYRVGLPMLSRHTACALTTVYNTDYTVNSLGAVCKLRETEDIAKSLSKLSVEIQGLRGKRPYAPAEGPPPPLGDCLRGLQDAQQARRTNGLGERMSVSSCSDDCENQGLFLLEKAKALAALNAGGAQEVEGALQEMPWGRLLRQVTPPQRSALLSTLIRLGELMKTGAWTTALAVVSAKGPAYTEDDPNAADSLSGHATVISRLLTPEGQYLHCPVEGTTHLAVDLPPPAGYAASFPVLLEGGASQEMDGPTFATILAQNVHEVTGISPDHSILAHIASDYGDQPCRCPFFVSTFYTGLQEGQDTLGCVPMDTKPPAAFGAGCRPVFGVPVPSLSRSTSMAVPVRQAMLHEDPAEHGRLLRLMEAQVEEAWSPSIDPEQVGILASFWHPVCPLGAQQPPAAAGTTLRAENAWAFDDPAHVRMGVTALSALADRFNALQARDPKSDGARAAAFGQYLSANLRIDVPNPRVGASFRLSTMRNLKRAVADVGLALPAACPLKRKIIASRARVASSHTFYMCAKGNGPVHAHRVRLA